MGSFIFLVVVLVPVLAIYLRWRLYNTADGERYVKMRTQGPFVPAGDDENKVIEQPEGAGPGV